MGSRPGASPTPHGCLLEEQNNLQPHWNVAAELGQNPASKTLSPACCQPEAAVLGVQAIVCPNPSCPGHRGFTRAAGLGIPRLEGSKQFMQPPVLALALPLSPLALPVL